MQNDDVAVNSERLAQIAVALEELAYDSDCSYHTWYRAGAMLIDANKAGAFGRADLAALRFDLERHLQRDGDPRFALRLVVRHLFPAVEMPREFSCHIWKDDQRQEFLQNWVPKLANWLRGQESRLPVIESTDVRIMVELARKPGVALTQYDLRKAGDRKTVGKRLEYLRTIGYVAHPPEKKRGNVLTEAGKARLEAIGGSSP